MKPHMNTDFLKRHGDILNQRKWCGHLGLGEVCRAGKLILYLRMCPTILGRLHEACFTILLNQSLERP